MNIIHGIRLHIQLQISGSKQCKNPLEIYSTHKHIIEGVVNDIIRQTAKAIDTENMSKQPSQELSCAINKKQNSSDTAANTTSIPELTMLITTIDTDIHAKCNTLSQTLEAIEQEPQKSSTQQDTQIALDGLKESFMKISLMSFPS